MIICFQGVEALNFKVKEMCYCALMACMMAIFSQIKIDLPEFDFESSTDFIEDGYLDSFDLVTLVAELDETYGISIDGLDIIPENFMSVETIAEVVKKNGGSL